MNKECMRLSKAINESLWRQQKTVGTAESCTGGGIAAALTSISGSSASVKGGVVAYTEEIKMKLLQVSKQTLAVQGVVSEETVVEMVKGAMETLNAHFAVASSGIAGPTGGTAELPVGTIWLAAGSAQGVLTRKIENWNHGRLKNTRHAVENALEILLEVVEKEENQV